MKSEVIYLFIILYKQVRLVTVENPLKNESVSVTANESKCLRHLAQPNIQLVLLDFQESAGYLTLKIFTLIKRKMRVVKQKHIADNRRE